MSLKEEDSIVSHSQLGLQAFNKSHQSQTLSLKKTKEQRKKNVNIYSSLLERFKEKRREESKRRGFGIPESKAELICRREIAATSDDSQVDAAALIYSFENFAHVLYMNRAELYKYNLIDFTSVKLAQAIQEIKNATISRQFIEQSSVPTPQNASSMWAHMFLILKRINNIESHFSILQTLFHSKDSLIRFACTDQCCGTTKTTTDRGATATAGCNTDERLREEIKKAKCRRCCVADTFFDQFYAPICFVRKNAFDKATQLTNLCEEIALEDSCQSMDVHFLSLFELIHLAMSSLEHLAMLNPLPSANVQSIIDDGLEEEELDSGVSSCKRKKQILRKNQLYADLPLVATYESAPEKVLYRGNIDSNLDVEKLVHDANIVRQRIENREIERRTQEQSNMYPSDSERLQRLKLMLENQFESISLQDGLHNRFSDERIEIYSTFIPSTSDKQKALIATYYVAETKKTRFGESLGGLMDPTTALKQFFPQDFENFERTKVLGEFSKYCKENKQSLLGRNKQFSLDKDLTAALVGKFFIAQCCSASKKITLTEELKQNIASCLETKWQEQIETPNVRAWSATLLEKINQWLENIETHIVKDVLYWSRVNCGESIQHNAQTKTFQEYASKCKVLAPWLFENEMSIEMKALFQRRSMNQSDQYEEFKQEEAIINFQFASNCKRLWPVDYAARYFQKEIFHSPSHLASEEQELLHHFSAMFFNRDLNRNLSLTRESMEKDTTLIWTVRCEPLFHGTNGFATHIGEDPFCKESVFAPNQKRDLSFNPSVQLHNYLWQFFRKKWSQEESAVVPQVAQLGSLIIDAYKKLSATKTDNTTRESNELDSIALERETIRSHLCQTIRDAEQFLPAKQLVVENDILKICKISGESLDDSHSTMLSMLGHSTMIRQERLFSPRLFEISRPFISLQNFSRFINKRLQLNLQKFTDCRQKLQKQKNLQRSLSPTSASRQKKSRTAHKNY